MDRVTFPGTYRDALGEEPAEWAFEPVARESAAPSFALTVNVRGIVLDASMLDMVEAELADRDRTEAAGLVLAPDSTQLTGCTFEGRIPITIEAGHQRRTAEAVFTLDFPIGETDRPSGNFLRMTLEADGTIHESIGDAFEVCLHAIDRSLRPEAGAICARSSRSR